MAKPPQIPSVLAAPLVMLKAKGGMEMSETSKIRPWVLLLSLWLALFWGMASYRAGPEEPAVTCAATERTLVPVGKTVGIKLFSHGVMVVRLSEVETQAGSISPAERCGLRVGDIITEMQGRSVNTIEEVEAVLRDADGAPLALQVSRNGKALRMTTRAARCCADGSYKLGAWVRDSMAGIGTVTWYDPQTRRFAALGHGVTDVDTGQLIPLKSGAVMPASVSGVMRGGQGCPGQLHGSFDLSHDLGSLTANSSRGIFGTAYDDSFAGKPVPVARRSEVKTGTASILCNIEGTDVQEYDVEILRIYPESASECQNLMIQVTDEALLSATGGVIQGMSGSPILQNGALVGALTHVLVNDPTRGYGILAEKMLERME